MLRIAISCGEGFSSGFLASRLNQLLKTEHLEDRAEFTFIPFPVLYHRQDEADTIMIMPHMEPRVAPYKDQFRVPMYIIPYKVITAVRAIDFIEDAEDILQIAKGRGGIFAFPEEQKTVNVTRLMSHRDWQQRALACD